VRAQTGPADSTSGAAVSTSGAADSTAGVRLITIQLERGEQTFVARVEYWTRDHVQAVRWDGREEFLPTHKIRSIVDADGRDVTRTVLEDRKSVGENPLSPRHRAHESGGPPLLGGPLPQYRWFLVTEAGAAARLDNGVDLYEKSGVYLILNAGAMKNVSERFALGATLYGGGDDYRLRFGLKGRVRYWINRTTSFDVAPGIIVAGDDDWSGGATYPGFVAEASLTIDRWLSLTGEVESIDVEHQDGRVERDVSTYAGIKVGGAAGIIVTMAGLLALAVTRAAVGDL